MSYIILIISCFVLNSCQKVSEPILTSFTPVSVVKVDLSEVILIAELTYINPNRFAGRLTEIYLNVYANDVYILDIDQELDIEIKANSEFVVTIDINIPVKSIIDKKSGLLGGLVNALTKREVNIKYVGTATVQFLKMKLPITIDKEELVSIPSSF